ncbi:hypothetical protein IQ285_37615 [Burkholderia sp. R-69608]|nr:hypothetical protein [Burkholderia sp. R-69608]MBK5186005.1 hypothetical protein [Burkholderia sp. R-69749]
MARLMRTAGLRGASRRRRPHTTQQHTGTRRAPDLVRRHFSAEAGDVLWIIDATYVPTDEGSLYLVVLDEFSRRLVAWAMYETSVHRADVTGAGHGPAAATPRGCDPTFGSRLSAQPSRAEAQGNRAYQKRYHYQGLQVVTIARVQSCSYRCVVVMPERLVQVQS